ncbi:HEAT repeat domain-containing protein [Anatilimnocola floriformis]|uniref:HEAT repeat domain-containing protein n=1 Tax=Anatilimnocola floriformis TaxID=2948575 RepID=UPI0020C33524|nr:hypothetical protein [Anatilimnocola floriformis]
MRLIDTTSRAATFLILWAAASWAIAKPQSAEEGQRQAAVVADFQQQFAAARPGPEQRKVLQRWMKDPSVEVRAKGVATAARLPAAEADLFFGDVLANEEDSGLRGEAASLLGTHGTEKSLAPLAHAAANDKTSDCVRGCIAFRTSARRQATFALADLAARFPALKPAVEKELRNLKPAEPQDGEQLADVRLQALYQVTQDTALLKPFYDRLASSDAKTRESGVVAFRFLRLKEAPAELVATLKDETEGVRLWGALVLGEIRDAKTAPQLLEVAADTRESLGVRCNAILSIGGMKVATLADPLRKLLDDEQVAIQAQAAIALYRLTGEKAKQFPAGYPAEPPGCE